MYRLFILAVVLAALLPVSADREEFSPEVEKALREAGANRKSLQSVLEAYRKSGDKEKYKAACFLVSNMVWHRLGGRVISYDAAIDSFRRAADAAYYALIKGTTAEMQEADPLHRTLMDSSAAGASRLAKYSFSDPMVIAEELPDVRGLDGAFIKRQVEHAFSLRKNVERVRRMPFEDFCRYVLPYRAIGGYPLVAGADEYAAVFNKYLQADTARNMTALGQRYNRALWWLKHYHGQYPFETLLGFPDAFFMGAQDCVDMAENGARILRSCGMPAVVEYNVAYRIWASRHFMVAIPDEQGRWMPFSPESQVPSLDYSGYRTCLNILRLHFERVPDNPYSLTMGTDEPLPEDLSDPCVEDVSALYMDVARLSLPATGVPANRRLAYLASFTPGVGLTAVTWGVRDKDVFRFDKVVKDNIYFPVFCEENGALSPFGTPFSLYSDNTRREGWRMEAFCRPTGRQVGVTLKRKYPRKPHLLEQARRTVGTVVLGCDTANFKYADTLAVITTVPEAEWTDITLNAERPYRYYRVAAPDADKHLHLSELQFLSHKKHGYTNVCHPVPLDGGAARPDSLWDRLMDEPLEKCQWKAEYDGNVQTAPDAWPDVTLRLEEPQWVERLRYVVKHAENGIAPGDVYMLYKWGSHGWENVWRKKAVTNSLDAGMLEVGALYWLRCVSRGKEELPFTVSADGTVLFPHEWVVREVEAGRH